MKDVLARPAECDAIELAHFCAAVAARRPVEIGGLDYAEEGIRIFAAFARPPGELVLV